jgi:SAM-dependent methyltransferase
VARFKEIIRRICWPILPGWPDEGRRIVQDGHLKALIARAAKESRGFPRVFNAGAGEGGFTRLLLSLPGVESLVESDYLWNTYTVKPIDGRQLAFCSSLEMLPLRAALFDLVFCTEVLEHIPKHEQALDELARIMNVGGWLLITVPTPPAVPDAAHAREGYRPAELTAMLQRRGFEVVESRYCMYFFFRLVLKKWSRAGWRSRIVIRSLSYLDRLIPLGPPMDLMLLARLAERPVLVSEEAPNATARGEYVVADPSRSAG